MIKIIKKGKKKELIEFICNHCKTEFSSDEYKKQRLPLSSEGFLPIISWNDCYVEECPNCKELTIKLYD